MLRRASLGVFTALLVAAPAAQAQTAQRWSVQLSALGVELTGIQNEDLRFGGGMELQGRWNPSAFSLGLGFQGTRHRVEDTLLARSVDVTYSGAFIEPRYIVGSIGDVVGIYVAGRLMALTAEYTIGSVTRSVDGGAVSGGGGFLVRLGSRLNLELGATVGKERYEQQEAEGTTVVTRLGLALGL